ncbi:hypothetical protein GW756_01125 [bacterium]|nr:hypothetical protein [bacterium]NCQ54958.1 hypothetical protein [Candidatus Parcubacteria bacterium]NCS67002.1 hypothetical protein [Candidatus Peregrinibacteria bacterium]NCS95948.1 hypothetical protein [bacterium]
MNKPLPRVQTLQSFFLKDKIIHELELHRLWVERFMFMLGLFSAAMAFPQIMTIYGQKDSSQVSLTAWGFYSFSAFLWLMYGIIFNRPVVKRVQILYLVTNLLVVLVILWYR